MPGTEKSKMQISLVVVLLFVAAVLNGAHGDGSDWSLVTSEDGTTSEYVDPSQDVEESDIAASLLKAHVIFNLYTVSNPETTQIIYLDDDDTLAASNFDATKPTRFVVHGWQSSDSAAMCTSIRTAYLGQGDYNVITVDWSAYASQDYITARTKVVAVGTYIGKMIDYLEDNGMSLDDLVVVGHSLGAHIAGVGSRSATNTVPNLVALDPAGPLFYVTTMNGRMRSTDATFIEVIHTNAGILGYQGELGTIDFWPNGGTWQSGCSFDFFGICSHARAYYFFAESITADSSDSLSKFVANTCSSYSSYSGGYCASEVSTYLGGAIVDSDAESGQYYLTTNSASPYAMG